MMPSDICCRTMLQEDIARVAPLYIEYYNGCEGGVWTFETTCRRIHQVWSAEDALCLILEENGKPIGFAMGHFEQYDDIKAYDLIEVVIAAHRQSCGLGSALMLELETRVKEQGGALIQLQAVNDARHERFYDRLQYRTATNLILKSKWLLEDA